VVVVDAGVDDGNIGAFAGVAVFVGHFAVRAVDALWRALG